jgi:hypothetical protein
VLLYLKTEAQLAFETSCFSKNLDDRQGAKKKEIVSVAFN